MQSVCLAARLLKEDDGKKTSGKYRKNIPRWILRRIEEIFVHKKLNLEKLFSRLS